MRIPLFLLAWLPALNLLATESTVTTPPTQYECSVGDNRKLISLDYPGLVHLCEVSVTPANGVREVKWYANQDSEFCKIKINELVGKFQTLWGHTCEDVKKTPSHSSLLDLTVRHRKAVDALIRDAKREGQDAGIPFTVTEARAHATEMTDKSWSALVVQLLMNAQDADITEPVDRTYFIEDDGKQFSTRSVWSGLRNSIVLQDNNYRIESAMINGINPNGDIIVVTELSPALKATDDGVSCTGNQTLKTTEDGSLSPASQHLINCE